MYRIILILFNCYFVFSSLVSKSQDKKFQDIYDGLKKIETLAKRHPDSALNISKNLLKIARETENDDCIYSSLTTIGNIYDRLNKYAEAVDFFQQAYGIAQTLNKPAFLAESQINIGKSRHSWSLYELSLENFNSALKIATENNLKEEESIALHHIGVLHFQQGKIHKSIEFLNKSLRIKEEVGDSAGISGVYVTLGVINKSIKNYDLANDYFSRSVSIKEQTGDITGICNIILHKGDIHYKKNEVDSALYYNKKGLDLINQINHPRLKSIALGNIGDILLLKGEYQNALKYLTSAQKIKESIGDRRRIVIGLQTLGDYHMKLENFDNALKYYRRSQNIADSAGLRELLLTTYLKLAQFHNALNQNKQSVKYYKQYIMLNDSIFGLRSQEQVNEFETKYQSQKKQARINLLEQESKIEELNRQRTKNINFFLFSFAGLLIILALVLFGRYRLKNRTSKELSIKNIELREVNKTKNQFFSIVAHDLRSHITAFQSAGKIVEHHIVQKNYDTALNYATQIETESEKLNNMLNNLLKWSVTQLHGYKISPEKINVKSEIEKITETFTNMALSKNIQFINTIEPELKILTDKGSFNVVFRNLISNAIKYSLPGDIHLSGKTNNGFAEISVSDCGKGISPEIEKQLFDIGEDKMTKGTAGESGTGLGLLLVKQFTELNNGEIDFQNSSKGAVFTVSLPNNPDNGKS